MNSAGDINSFDASRPKGTGDLCIDVDGNGSITNGGQHIVCILAIDVAYMRLVRLKMKAR